MRRRAVQVSGLVLLSAAFGVLGLLAPAGADGQVADYPSYPGAPAEGCLVLSPTVVQTGDSVTLTNNCGEAVDAFLNKLPFPNGLPSEVTVPCGLDVIRTHTVTALLTDGATDAVYSASAELLVTGSGPNCDGVPNVPVYSCPAGSAVAGGSGPSLTCASFGNALKVAPNVSPNPPVISCPAGATGPIDGTCTQTITLVDEISAEEVDGEFTCPDSHPNPTDANTCLSNARTETEQIEALVTPQAPTISCPAGTVSNGAPTGAKQCLGESPMIFVQANVSYVCASDLVSNEAPGDDKVCLPNSAAATPVAAYPAVAAPAAPASTIAAAPAIVQPAAVVVHVAPAPAPVIVQAPVIATASSFGFGSSLPTHAPSTDPGKKATALAHTGASTTYFLYSGLALIAAGAILLGSQRRRVRS